MAKPALSMTEPRVPDAFLTVRRSFPAPRQRVFEAFTNADALKAWWGPDGYGTPVAELDLRVGGRYRLGMRKLPDGEIFYLTGTYREILPPERLVYTWTWEHEEAIKDTVVTIEFRESTGLTATDVVITHELLPTPEWRERHGHGWNSCLDKLARVLAPEA